MSLILTLILCLPSLAQDETVLEHLSGRGAGGMAPLLPKAEGRLRVLVGGGVTALAADDRGLSGSILEGAGLDAVALGADELAAAKADPARLARLPFVAANLVDAAGKPVVRTHAIVKAGSRRVALVGLTKPARPAEPPAGWRLDDPAAALRALLPTLEGQADSIVLLAVMDRLDAGALLKAAGRPCIAIVPARGANSPEPLKIGECWLVQSPDGDRVLGALSISPRGVGNTFNDLKLSEADLKRLRELASRQGLNPGNFVTNRKPPAGTDDGPATAFEPGKTRSIWSAAANRALEARVYSFLVTPDFGGRKAPEGRAWLVLDTEWTNQIAMSFVFERETPVAFQIGDFREILYVVVNGSRLARLDPDSVSGPGGLTEKEFMLPYVGSSRRGLVLFDVPASGIETLDLRFYDFTHGHLSVPILVKPAPAADKPLASGKNQILEASVWSVRKDKTGAPEGMAFVRVDLRARSTWPVEVDASAFDPKVQKPHKVKVPSLGRWEDIRRLSTLALDSDRTAEAHESSVLADSTILLPDAATGDDLVFLVPDGATPRELRLGFEAVSVPGKSDPVKPTPLKLPLGQK